jgi:hypothetical protein
VSRVTFLKSKKTIMDTNNKPFASGSSNEHASAVSWSAIIAGSAATAALSLILLMLGIGLGLSSVSPWTFSGIQARTMGVVTIIWLTLTQAIASGVGGYLSGRLRTKWLAVHSDEVFFRDSAHGFLTWAVASIASAAVLSSAIGSIVTGGIQASAPMIAKIANIAPSSNDVARVQGVAATSGPMSYSIGFLFRSGGKASLDSPNSSKIAEVVTIFENSIQTGPLPADDIRYIGQLVSQQTGRQQDESEKRVVDTYSQLQSTMFASITALKAATDSLRKTSTYATLWLFISLLIGAFCASLAATWGGNRRDR